MELIKTKFEGLYIIQHNVFKDSRGLFIKTYSETIFRELGIGLKIKERYFSISHKNVIRGMHFQSPPEDHCKLITVIQGSITDVVLDIRDQSKTFGKFFSIILKGDLGQTLYIPSGFAHGFLAMEDNTIVEYNQTTCYSQVHDTGIRYDSFGFIWNAVPIVSERDSSFIHFKDFYSPFK